MLTLTDSEHMKLNFLLSEIRREETRPRRRRNRIYNLSSRATCILIKAQRRSQKTS